MAVDDKAHVVMAEIVWFKKVRIFRKGAADFPRVGNVFHGATSRLEAVQRGTVHAEVEFVAEVSFKKTEEASALLAVQFGELVDPVAVDEDGAEIFACD